MGCWSLWSFQLYRRAGDLGFGFSFGHRAPSTSDFGLEALNFDLEQVEAAGHAMRRQVVVERVAWHRHRLAFPAHADHGRLYPTFPR